MVEKYKESFDQFLNNNFKIKVKEYYSDPKLQWSEAALLLFGPKILSSKLTQDEGKALLACLKLAIGEYEKLWQEFLQNNDRRFDGLTMQSLTRERKNVGDVYHYRKEAIEQMTGSYFQNLNNSEFLKTKKLVNLEKLADTKSLFSLDELRLALFNKIDRVYQKIIMDKVRNRDQQRQNLELNTKDSYDFEYLTLAFYHRLLSGTEREDGQKFNIRARKSTIEDDHFNGIDLSLAFGDNYDFAVGVDTTLNDAKVEEKTVNANENMMAEYVYSGSAKANLKQKKQLDKLVIHLSSDDFPLGVSEVLQYLKAYLFSETKDQYEKISPGFIKEFENLEKGQSPYFLKDVKKIGQVFERQLYEKLGEKILNVLFYDIPGLRNEIENNFSYLYPKNYIQWKKMVDFLRLQEEQLKLSVSKKMILNEYTSALAYLVSSKRFAKILK